jgi:hypothetical protein
MKFNGFLCCGAAFACVIFMVSCSLEDFSRHYRQLDKKDVRPFSYKFENPEMAPGDTVCLSVIFNEAIDINEIKWRVNWNYMTNRFGSSTPVNGFEKDLKLIGAPSSSDTHNGHSQTVTVKFVVPDSMLYDSWAIPTSLEEMAAMYNFRNIPKVDFPTGKNDILNKFETLAKSPYSQEQIPDSLHTVIDGLAQIFSAMFEIYIDIDGSPRSKIRHTVRYHGKLSYGNYINGGRLKGVYYNRNPEIDKIYVFYEDGSNQQTLEDGDTMKISLNRNQTKLVQFFPNPKDFAITLEKAFSPRSQWDPFGMQDNKQERYYVRWFLEGSETYQKLWFTSEGTQPSYGDEGDISDITRIINIDYDKVKPGDTGYLFLVLFDDIEVGVVYRPQGRTTLGFPIKFVE